MRILLLSDSMALPREEFDYDRPCYLAILKKHFPAIDFQSLSLGKATLPMLVEQYDRYYQYFKPDLVILHCGIVDCAPRALSKLEQTLFSRLPFIGSTLRRHRRFLRNNRNLAYTSEKNFRYYLERLRASLDGRLVVIGIAPPVTNYRARLPGIADRVESYNLILKNEKNFIDLSDLPDSCVGNDDYHFNSKGHEFVAYRLKSFIDQIIEQ